MDINHKLSLLTEVFFPDLIFNSSYRLYQYLKELQLEQGGRSHEEKWSIFVIGKDAMVENKEMKWCNVVLPNQ